MTTRKITSAVVFWSTSPPAAQMDRLRYYLTEDPKREKHVFIAAAGPQATFGVAQSKRLPDAAQRWCPWPLEPLAYFTDPDPLALRERLRELLAPYRTFRSWYTRAEVEDLVIAVRERPMPYAPPMPIVELPERYRLEQPTKSRQRQANREARLWLQEQREA